MFDDSDKDPDFNSSLTSKNSSDYSSSQSTHLSIEDNVQNAPVTTKGKKRLANPTIWKKAIAKRLRNTGQEYNSCSSSNIVIPAKKS